MKRLSRTTTLTALALALGACGSSNEQTAENAMEQAAVANDMNAMMADPNNPFSQTEMQMNERMMAAVGTDAGDSWARKMIEHHQGAIDMSRLMLGQNPSPDVATMARETVAAQEKEIANIRKLLKEGAPNPQSGELYRSAITDMNQKMMAAKGADFSETFMRKMLAHHNGGVALSDIALQNGVSGALRTQVQKTRDGQQREAKMVEAMLAGQTHHQAMVPSGTKSADEDKAEPAPADRARSASAPKPSAPKAAPKPPAKEVELADPHAGHDMNNM